MMEEIYDWEREEVEDIIWDAFNNKKEIELAQFLPKLEKYDGIRALKESPYLLQIPSEASVEIGKILYEVMGLLFNKGIIKDRSSIKESNDVISLRKKFKSEDCEERKRILERFEKGELTL